MGLQRDHTPHNGLTPRPPRPPRPLRAPAAAAPLRNVPPFTDMHARLSVPRWQPRIAAGGPFLHPACPLGLRPFLLRAAPAQHQQSRPGTMLTGRRRRFDARGRPLMGCDLRHQFRPWNPSGPCLRRSGAPRAPGPQNGRTRASPARPPPIRCAHAASLPLSRRLGDSHTRPRTAERCPRAPWARRPPGRRPNCRRDAPRAGAFALLRAPSPGYPLAYPSCPIPQARPKRTMPHRQDRETRL